MAGEECIAPIGYVEYLRKLGGRYAPSTWNFHFNPPNSLTPSVSKKPVRCRLARKPTPLVPLPGGGWTVAVDNSFGGVGESRGSGDDRTDIAAVAGGRGSEAGVPGVCEGFTAGSEVGALV